MIRKLNALFSLAILIFLLAPMRPMAQTFLGKEQVKAVGSFEELQVQLQQWSQDPVLRKTKGWKWLKRWESFHAQRMSPNGPLFDGDAYAQGVQQFMADRSATNKTATNSSWVPLGPNNYAQPGWPGWETGLGRTNCVAFHPTDSLTFWAGVAQGGVWKTVDGGQSWTPLTDDLPMLRISDICPNPANPDEIYIAVGDMAYFGAGLKFDDRKRHTHYGLGVYKTTDGGASWNPTGLSFAQTSFDFSLTSRIYMDPANAQRLVAATTTGIWKTLDAGANWTRTHDSIIWDLEMDPVTPQVLYASTGYRASMNVGSASIMKSTDFGSTWTVLPTGIPARGLVQRIELAVAPSDPNYVYALCAGMDAGFAGLYRSTDAGASWSLQSNSPNILEWYDGFGGGGQGWYDLAILVNPTDRNTIYTGGVNMWASTDGGVSWDGCSYWLNDYGQSIHADQHQFAYNPLDGKYYISNDGGLYRTSEIIIGSWVDANNNPGYQWPTTWEKLSGGMQITSFYRCSTTPAASGNLIAGAQDNGTYFYNGTDWLNIIGGDGMECILHPNDPYTLYGSSQYGNLAASYDGGLTTNGMGWINEVGEWTTPFLLDPTNPDVIYAAYGNVWKSVDAGFSWNAISSFPNNSTLGQPNISSALAVCHSDPNYIYCAKRYYHSVGEPSALWVTTNGGGSWTDRTAGLPDSLYITYIAVDADAPATAWVTVGGFVAGAKVFKTTDAGATWTNMSLNLPNLQTNCILHDRLHANNPLYVGMDVGVYYFNDTLGTWIPYATDLPNVIVSELELDAPNQQIVAATFGRGLWGVSLRDAVLAGVEPGQASLLDMSIAPNPNDGGHFLLTVSGQAHDGAELSVIDVMGRVIHRRSLAPFDGHVSESLDLGLSAGCYFLQVQVGARKLARKFVVR